MEVNLMKCEKNNERGCKKDCPHWLKQNAEPEKYMCVTFPHGIDGEDTILVEIAEWNKMMKAEPHKVKHQQENGTWK